MEVDLNERPGILPQKDVHEIKTLESRLPKPDRFPIYLGGTISTYVSRRYLNYLLSRRERLE